MKHKTTFHLPFRGSWLTFWGGDSEELNRHARGNTQAQVYAFDFCVVDEHGKSHKQKGGLNNHYYAFGQDILSPANGEVVESVDGVRDNKPGDTNPYMAGGNYVLIKHVNKEFSKLAHLRNGSLRVRAGDRVQAGEKIGECGNSGNTSQPHLHFHLQDSDIFARFNKEYKNGLQQIAQGIKVYFSDIEVKTNDEKGIKPLHSPVKGEIVKNVN